MVLHLEWGQILRAGYDSTPISPTPAPLGRGWAGSFATSTTPSPGARRSDVKLARFAFGPQARPDAARRRAGRGLGADVSDAAVQLPAAPAPRPAATERAEWLRLAARARLLSWVSLAYMTLEGGVAIVAGLAAGSMALIGFGIDSAIEGFASLVIVWRFTGSRLLSGTAERRAQRLVAIQFFLLAPYVGFEATQALVTGERPDASSLGIGLATTSLAVMPLLGRAK